MASGEIIIAQQNVQFKDASSAADGLDFAHTHAAALQAGFGKWIESVNRYDLEGMGRAVSDALSMPYPSLTTQALRAEAGFPTGVNTPAKSLWSLAISSELSDEPYDLGVQLVTIKTAPGKAQPLRVPLDLTITPHTYKDAQTRPDRIIVRVGERQIPTAKYFHEGDAQRLILVAVNFISLLARAGTEGATVLALPAPKKRFFVRR